MFDNHLLRERGIVGWYAEKETELAEKERELADLLRKREREKRERAGCFVSLLHFLSVFLSLCVCLSLYLFLCVLYIICWSVICDHGISHLFLYGLSSIGWGPWNIFHILYKAHNLLHAEALDPDCLTCSSRA